VSLESFERVVLDIPRELQIDGINDVHCHLVIDPLGLTHTRNQREATHTGSACRIQVY
jgi:hypothetical protein